MQTPAPIDNQWVDILSPLPPVYSVSPLLVAAVVVPLVALVGLAIYYYSRPRVRARRALQRLARRLHESEIEARPLCLQVRQRLRDGLGRQRLQSMQWDEDSNAGWQDYVQRLRQACFSPSSPSLSEQHGIICEALDWLSRKGADS